MKNLAQLENAQLENYNTNVISIGLNMNCDEVITKSALYKKDGTWFVKNGGIHMHCINLRDYFLDNKENRKQLRKTI